MTETDMGLLEQYDPAHIVRKEVFVGARSKTMLLHLLPGQEVPAHPHAGYDIMLVPQKGRAVLTLDGAREIALTPDHVYHEGDGHVFRIENRGDAPFQMLAMLVRVGEAGS